MDRDFLIDLFAEFGPVTIRRMFSGYGVSADGVNFAMVLRGAIFFRTDAQSVPAFEAEGMGPFQYQQRTSGKTVTVNSYWKIPDRLYDDNEDLARWARVALAAAQRAAANKPPGSHRTKAAGVASPGMISQPKIAKRVASKTTVVQVKAVKRKLAKPAAARSKPKAGRASSSGRGR